MVKIKISELKKLPYISGIPAENQNLYICPYFDEDRKQYSIKYFDENGDVLSLCAIPVESFYYSKSKTDIEKDFLQNFSIFLFVTILILSQLI